ncbi:carcinoembryonic antigen-related cell adhesion molecule 8-like [Trematomus bernacchii]|uniref:carcinoembryonic antigen-related cell adhesion molecule 8-like n=1 Tax=Trematomus bernacchii TaxID=40690 RepID=UPI00146A0CDF|nr:carcinoembryonic antigen-related cell adhesion molecule 8-like [Trematomus bernacchii]
MQRKCQPSNFDCPDKCEPLAALNISVRKCRTTFVLRENRDYFVCCSFVFCRVSTVDPLSLCLSPGLTEGAGVLPDGPLNAAVRETVMFTTNLTPGTPFQSVTWKFGPENIFRFYGSNLTAPEYEGRITFFMSTGSLELRNLALTDRGDYSVDMFIAEARPQSGRTRLDVYEPVSNVTVTSSSTELVEFNSSVSLSCSSSGSSLSFLWLNSSSEVTGSDRVQITDGGSTLTIINVTRYDQGPFRCRVSNPFSEGTSKEVNLSISFGKFSFNSIYFCSCFYIFHLIFCPTEKVSGASVTSPSNLPIEGNSFRLICDAAGSVFTREWRKGVLDLTLTVNMTLTNNNRELSFSSLNKEDKGDYSCIISNPLSSEEAKYSMIVIYGPETVQITGPSQIHVGGTFKLTCSAASVPTAKYTWMPNTGAIVNSAVIYRNNTELYDSGNYYCEARNDITGRRSSAVHELTVTHTVPPGCSGGCIAGIVIAVLVVLGVVAAIVWYCFHNKKAVQRKKSFTT